MFQLGFCLKATAYETRGQQASFWNLQYIHMLLCMTENKGGLNDEQPDVN